MPVPSFRAGRLALQVYVKALLGALQQPPPGRADSCNSTLQAELPCSKEHHLDELEPTMPHAVLKRGCIAARFDRNNVLGGSGDRQDGCLAATGKLACSTAYTCPNYRQQRKACRGVAPVVHGISLVFAPCYDHNRQSWLAAADAARLRGECVSRGGAGERQACSCSSCVIWQLESHKRTMCMRVSLRLTADNSQQQHDSQGQDTHAAPHVAISRLRRPVCITGRTASTSGLSGQACGTGHMHGALHV
jgi:hypothetical protein